MKYLNFEEKLPIPTADVFLESKHPEVTKNPYYVLSPKGNQKRVPANGLIPVCRGVYIHYFKINPPHFLLSSLFWKLSQILGQDQENSQQTLLIIIFLWTPEGFISPESFLNFLLNLYIPPWLQKSFKFIVLRLLQIHLWRLSMSQLETQLFASLYI